jgi:hypothetical protein
MGKLILPCFSIDLNIVNRASISFTRYTLLEDKNPFQFYVKDEKIFQ